MKKLELKLGILLATMLTAFGGAKAQDTDQLHLNVGDAKFYPSVKLEYVSDDNILRNSDAVASSGMVVAPVALFVADRRGLAVQFGYEGGYGIYDEEFLNYNDHHIFGRADAEFGVRERGVLDVSVRKAHQSLGVGLTSGNASVGDDPVEYVEGKIYSEFTYGAATARFNVSGGLLILNRSFENRNDVSNGRSFNEITPSAQVSYRLSIDTRTLLQLKYRSLSFDNSSRDRDELQILTGLEFKGSGKLSGVAKIGIAQPDHADANRENESILTVDTTLTYQPSSLSWFDLRFERQFDNGGSLNDGAESGQVIDDSVSLRWNKKWSGFVSSTALIEAEFEGGGCPVDQSDTLRAALDVGLKAKRWMTFGVGVANTSYSESQCDPGGPSGNDYDLVELKAFVTLSL